MNSNEVEVKTNERRNRIGAIIAGMGRVALLIIRFEPQLSRDKCPFRGHLVFERDNCPWLVTLKGLSLGSSIILFKL